MFNRPFVIILTVILLLFILVAFLPIVVTNWSWIRLNVDKPNEIGDTVGGIMGPVVGFIGVVVTFLAFWMQYKANEKQFEKFDDQEKDTQLERFENKFYELIKIHRDNVNEFEIVRKDGKGMLKGRRIFVEMFEELRLAYKAVEWANRQLIIKGEILEDYYSQKEIYDVAYIIYFNGFSRTPILDLKPNELWEFKIFNDKNNKLLYESFDNLKSIRVQLNDEFAKVIKIGAETKFEIFYKPSITYKTFSGHNSRLGHYYRSLYQLVSFVVDYNNEIVKDKYSYTKIIRAQLSNHEQILLYYNSLSVLGTPWLDRKFLNEWSMIKNMPLSLADFYYDPKSVLGEKNSKGEYIFEVDEVAQRLNLN